MTNTATAVLAALFVTSFTALAQRSDGTATGALFASSGITRGAAAEAQASPRTSPPATLKPQANIVQGTVRYADGRPLPGATILIRGTSGPGQSRVIETKSDRNGTYRIQVPAGDYNIDAVAAITFAGKTYQELWLNRTDNRCERQLSAKGIVRHFVLELTGLRECINNSDPNEPGSYNGGYVSAAFPLSLDEKARYATAKLAITFTPQGALADGSAGRAITFTRTVQQMSEGYKLGEGGILHDIPLGRYKVSAQLILPNSARQPLTVTVDGSGQEGTSVDYQFQAAQFFPYGIRSESITIRLPG